MTLPSISGHRGGLAHRFDTGVARQRTDMVRIPGAATARARIFSSARRAPRCGAHAQGRNSAMLDPKLLDEISAKMSALLAATPARDIEKNAKAMLSGMLGRLDLVTRDEFDVQTQVLARTREKLTALEARVEALEKALQAASK
jgi:hypothetical protein